MPDNESLVRAAQRHGTLPPRILHAMRAIDRRLFVPSGTPPAEIYDDRPVGIGSGQTTSQPSLVAAMIAAVDPRPDQTVLEIGTGFGYQTALLAQLCAHVVSIDRISSLSKQAARNLEAAGVENTTLLVGNAWDGVENYEPFGAIVVSAAADEIPQKLIPQLAEEGRMVIPIGPGGNEIVEVFEKRAGKLKLLRRLTGARFVPLRRD